MRIVRRLFNRRPSSDGGQRPGDRAQLPDSQHGFRLESMTRANPQRRLLTFRVSNAANAALLP